MLSDFIGRWRYSYGMSEADLELLEAYVRKRSEDSFEELVRRYLDFVYCAALRQVRSPQLAEDVTQCTFTELARSAARLKPDTTLPAWLYQVTRRTAIDLVRREKRRQTREQVASEMSGMNSAPADWSHLEPLLDDAMHSLGETDRAAVLLRYFENRSLKEVGLALGASEDAAQKRVSRAVEQLRAFFDQRGLRTQASALAAVICANSVQAAPVGLVATISTGAFAAATSAALNSVASQAIAMTALQKIGVTVSLIAVLGTGIYEARRASSLRAQVLSMQRQQAPLADEIQRLNEHLQDATNLAAALKTKNEDLTQGQAELLRLRGEVGMLRRKVGELEGTANARRPSTTSLIDVGTGRPIDSTLAQTFARESWAFAGYATPEATLLTMSWASDKGDVEKFLGGFAPEIRKTIEESLPRHALQPEFPKEVTGITIVGKEVLSDDEVVLSFFVDHPRGMPKTRMNLRKIGNEWKIAQGAGHE